jgi:hypothetical protein
MRRSRSHVSREDAKMLCKAEARRSLFASSREQLLAASRQSGLPLQRAGNKAFSYTRIA